MLVDHWRTLEPLEKARIVDELTEWVCRLSLVGLRRQHPSATEREIELMGARIRLGEELWKGIADQVDTSLPAS